MRVAVDAENLVRDRRGMGRHVRAILSGLPEHGVEPTLICRTKNGAQRLQELMPQAHVTRALEAKNHRCDVAWFPWNGMRFNLHIPSVLTIHDLFAFEEPHPNFIARFREQSPISRGVQRASQIATVSKWSAQRIQERFALRGKPLHVVPPILEAFWNPTTKHVASGPFFVFVAGPEARKNVPFFLDAFERAFPEHQVRLCIVGSLSQRDEALLATKTFSYERVEATDERLAQLYSQALGVVVPSRSEGYGLVALEAMACGAAVLASNAAALPEACGDAALLLDPYDVVAWSQALGRVAHDASLRDDLRSRSLLRARAIDRAAAARAMAELFLSLR